MLFMCFLCFLCFENLFAKKKKNCPNDLIYITTWISVHEFIIYPVQEFIEMQGLLLLTFLICSQTQLSSIHSISYFNKECKCLNEIFHQIDRKWMVVTFTNFYDKIWVGFCPNTGKRFVLMVSFLSQEKEHGFF